jgi:hypothetical protein
MSEQIILYDGKYKIIIPQSADEKFECFRYDEPWRDLTGDGMVMALCQRILACDEFLVKHGYEKSR